jgi:hypothetical protein
LFVIQVMRPTAIVRIAGVLFVTAAVLVAALALGREVSERRAEQSTDFQAFAPVPAGAAGGAALALPVRCDGVALNAARERFADLAWSPDSMTLAATRLADDGSPTRIALMHAPDWNARDIGEGRSPRWSASGELLAFEQAPGMLRVVNVRSGQQLATLASTSNAYAWQGDALLFWRGSQVRAWGGAGDALRFEVASEYAPTRGFEPSFSGDGSRVALVRREEGRIAQFLFGATDDGRVSPQSTPVSYSWSPVGRKLLLQSADGETLFNEAKQSATIGRDQLAGVFVGWSPDGLRALFATPASTTLLGWDGTRIDAVADAVLTDPRSLVFARDARKVAALGPSALLTVLACADAVGNDPRVRITRDEAIALVRQRPDVISIGSRIEAKLVVWAEIKRNLTRFTSATTAAIEPSTPVWVVAMIGEVRRPPSWNPPGAKSTYPLGLFVLDAGDGHELAMQVTIGTWWIGDGFDDLNGYGVLPPATTPQPGAFALPVVQGDYTVTPVGQNVRIDSAAGWSVDAPKHWWVSATYGRYGNAVLTNFDPDYGSTTHVLWAASRDRVRLSFEIWRNEDRLPLAAWVDSAFRDGVSQRASTTLGGRPAQVLTQYRNFGPPPNGDQWSRFWVVPTGPVTMLVISAFPADTVRLADVERFLGSLKLRAPAVSAPVTITRADAVRIATERTTGSQTAKPLQVRVDRAEAKLIRSAEAAQVTGPFQGTLPAPLAAAPDDPVWMVVLAGDLGATSGICRGPVACQPHAILWNMWVIDARTGEVRHTNSSGLGAWPTFFGALPDRS